MTKLFLSTAKYYLLSIRTYLPLVTKLYKESDDQTMKKQLKALIEMYNDVASKINIVPLNVEDPNKEYDIEPDEVEVALNEKNIAHFSQLQL